jgi:hypothetical protein
VHSHLQCYSQYWLLMRFTFTQMQVIVWMLNRW